MPHPAEASSSARRPAWYSDDNTGLIRHQTAGIQSEPPPIRRQHLRRDHRVAVQLRIQLPGHMLTEHPRRDPLHVNRHHLTRHPKPGLRMALHIPQHRVHRRVMRRQNLATHLGVRDGGEDRHRLRRRERHVIPTHRPLTKRPTQRSRQRTDRHQPTPQRTRRHQPHQKAPAPWRRHRTNGPPAPQPPSNTSRPPPRSTDQPQRPSTTSPEPSPPTYRTVWQQGRRTSCATVCQINQVGSHRVNWDRERRDGVRIVEQAQLQGSARRPPRGRAQHVLAARRWCR